MWIGCLIATFLSDGSVEAGEVRVTAAISLAPAVRSLGDAWGDASGHSVSLHAGGSAALVQQVLRGAPSDLFLSASPELIDRLDDEGLTVATSRTVFVSNHLVLVSPSGVEPPASPAELTGRRWQRIAIGNPRTAPLGVYTREALEAAGLWDELQPRLILGENARQVIDYVARGEVDAGIVYGTDLGLRDDVRGGIRVAVPRPILYEAVLLSGKRQAIAGEFLAFVLSPRGREILERHGFHDPAEPDDDR